MALNEIQRRIRRSRQSERDLGKWLLEHDGEDPLWSKLASSTGRVGHYTNLQFDVVSMTYAGENKQVRIPVKWVGFWLQIIDVAKKHGKVPLLVIEPTNVNPGRRIPNWHVITEEHHQDLLAVREEYYAMAAKYEALLDGREDE